MAEILPIFGRLTHGQGEGMDACCSCTGLGGFPLLPVPRVRAAAQEELADGDDGDHARDDAPDNGGIGEAQIPAQARPKEGRHLVVELIEWEARERMGSRPRKTRKRERQKSTTKPFFQ